MQSKICVLQVIPNLDVSGASQGCVDVANYLTEKIIIPTLQQIQDKI